MGQDAAPTDVPMPRFTALVVVKGGSWAQRLVLEQDKRSEKNLIHGNYIHGSATYPDSGTMSTLDF
jgi:hypothetical protein